MNIVKTLDQFDISGVYFSDPIKNNIMNEGRFVRVLYSTDTFVLNGIYLLVCFNNIYLENYFNKLRCSFDIETNKDVINRIKIIEDSIIKKVGCNINGKIGQCKIYEQIQTGNIKVFSENIKQGTNNNTYILKISGIWETDEYFGLTYKFVRA
jgi:hypothetical protein